MATLSEIQAITKRIKAERDANKPAVDQDLLKRQRDAKVNSVMRSGFRQRNSV